MARHANPLEQQPGAELQTKVRQAASMIVAGDLTGAMVRLCHAVALHPDHAGAWNTLGLTLHQQGEINAAVACYSRAHQLDPDNVEVRWNRALAWLVQGDFERGWPEYEWRWKSPKAEPLPYAERPRWDGSPLGGAPILLHANQGLGDTIQFIRYAPLVKSRGGTVIVQCQPELIPLLSNCGGIALLTANEAPPPPVFTVQAPMLSLPGILGTTVETIPSEVPYIAADPTLVAQWGKRLSSVKGFRVGISWQGNPKHYWDHRRSFSLNHFESLARIDGVRLISLQKGPGEEHLDAASGRFPITLPGDHFDETTGAFMDTAAVLNHLDLVITPDTALAHLAGAMDVPTWVALSFSSDWRWLRERDDSPWYPSLRLFRQERLGDWGGVFARMADALRRLTRR